MSTPTRIIGFGVVLALLFGAAFGVGRFFDDENPEADGYSLRLTTSQSEPGGKVAVRFAVLDPGQQKVTRFAVRHQKRLHLIAVSKDFSRFRHVHPTMTADGDWTIALDLAPGEWRLFADFQPEGATNKVADIDLTVRGEPVVVTDVEPHTIAGIDGYQVKAIGDLVAGGDGGMLEFEVTKNGKPVTDLEPYLGSYGHLVVLRETDMKYLHVHPEAGPSGPRIAFHVEVPTPGVYYLYLDFKRDGVVRTAAVVLGATRTADAGHSTDRMDGMDDADH